MISWLVVMEGYSKLMINCVYILIICCLYFYKTGLCTQRTCTNNLDMNYWILYFFLFILYFLYFMFWINDNLHFSLFLIISNIYIFLIYLWSHCYYISKLILYHFLYFEFRKGLRTTFLWPSIYSVVCPIHKGTLINELV